MKLKSIIILTLVVSICTLKSFGQTNPSTPAGKWSVLDADGFSIQYPSDWELQQNGLGGTTFIVLSPITSSEDLFRENVNLLIQDLTGQNIDLNKYTAISEEQIKTMIANGHIIESKRVASEKNIYQKEIYTGDQGIYKLKFEQYYWVLDNKAYVLTFTAAQTNFDAYKADGEKILNSFHLKHK